MWAAAVGRGGAGLARGGVTGLVADVRPATSLLAEAQLTSTHWARQAFLSFLLLPPVPPVAPSTPSPHAPNPAAILRLSCVKTNSQGGQPLGDVPG